MAARDPSATPVRRAQVALPPTVQCDCCEAPFVLPASMVRNGRIFGMIVCTQCAEDAAEARASNRQLETSL